MSKEVNLLSGKFQSGKFYSIMVPHKRRVNRISNRKFFLNRFIFLVLCIKVKRIPKVTISMVEIRIDLFMCEKFDCRMMR